MFIWCPERDLNPHALEAKDFESFVSTIPPSGQILKARKSYRFRAFSQTILFFVETEKILFKTSITASLWFHSL